MGKVLQKFERRKHKLISNRDRVQLKVEAIDHKIEKVNDVVFEWLKETEILMQDMENLKTQSRISSLNEYRKLRKRIKALNIKCVFEPFSTPILSLERFSSENNFMCFKSTEKASDEVLEALQDDNCSIIGLYGRHGSGKTTLVKAIGKKVEHLKIFYEVLFVNVTENPNITTLQDEIADLLNIRFDRLLNMKFDRNGEAKRARKILSTIENMDRPILVIIDDVRAIFDLERVGIPCHSNRCKVLLTARCKQDCELMNCQRKIQLDPVSTEEACNLLKVYSAIHHEENSELLNVAREVAIECEGLPKNIIKVGTSLRSKPMEEWKASLENLRNPIAQWQMFLSFRGEDTRFSFTGFLYQALRQGGFKTFIDDEGLQTGDQIACSLKDAIETSRLSIVVLSENYANSAWCLDELVKIFECAELKNQLVWPIFYKVDPSDIRHLRKSYGKAMAHHEKILGVHSEKIRKWKSALLKVSDLSGKPYTTGYEYEFIQKIVEDAKHIENRLQIELEDHRRCQTN
jgi:DNA replication protein DnaC